MKKEELLNEMYALIKRFDRDLIDLMNLMRKSGELSEEIDMIQQSGFYDSNPLIESVVLKYSIDKDICIGCGMCVKKCYANAITKTGYIAPNHKLTSMAIDAEKCNKCGACIDACKFGAIQKGSYAYKEGEQYDTVVERILPKVGAFCRVGSRTDGMIHISKMSETRINSVEDVLHIGDKVKVEIIRVGDKGIDLKLIQIMN